MLSYPSGLPVSTRALNLLTGALRAHRDHIGSRWRRLSPGRQALLVLAHLRKSERYAELAAGFDVGIAAVRRYVHEALAVLAAMTPTLQQAVTTAAAKAYVVLVAHCVGGAPRHAAAHRPCRQGRQGRFDLLLRQRQSPWRQLGAPPAQRGSRPSLFQPGG